MANLPKVMVLVHKSLLDNAKAIAAIHNLMWWNELPEEAPIKYSVRRELGGIMYVIDPTKEQHDSRYPANAYKLSDSMDW